MGNDIKLPVSQRKEISESHRTSEAEARAQLNYEIEKITNQVTSISNQIDKVEYNLKQISRNIQYYQKLISEMSVTLHQIQMEQINASLSHENYVERAKWYLDLESLTELDEVPEQDEIEEYPPNKICHLEETVATLNNEVSVIEDIINNKFKEMSN